MEPAIDAWRRERRTDLLQRRQAIPPEARQRAAAIIVMKLTEIVAAQRRVAVGLYWPIKQEINLLPWANELAERNILLCLPVVVTRKAPLEYWRWRPGEALDRGVWNIPVPALRDLVNPDVMLAPLVGFDRANYRLGYGGGYFDRTLASLPRRPMVIGVGYAFSALKTIFPQPHDIAMDAVVTEQSDRLPPDGDRHGV